MKRFPARVVIRYTLFQIPELFLLIAVLWALQKWFTVPFVWLGTILVLWIAKDIILFFFVWRAYEIPRSKHDPRLEGAEGLAIEDLKPQGYVDINGELWRAQSVDKKLIKKGRQVEVIDHKGLLLIVKAHPIS